MKFAGSSNGRTEDFDSSDLGSNPSPAAKDFTHLIDVFCLTKFKIVTSYMTVQYKYIKKKLRKMAKKKKTGILDGITSFDVLLNVVSSNSQVNADAIKILCANIKELSDEQLARFHKLDIREEIPEIGLEINIRKLP